MISAEIKPFFLDFSLNSSESRPLKSDCFKSSQKKKRNGGNTLLFTIFRKTANFECIHAKSSGGMTNFRWEDD